MCSLPLHQVGPLIHGAVLLRPNFGFGPRLLDPAIMSFRTQIHTSNSGDVLFLEKKDPARQHRHRRPSWFSPKITYLNIFPIKKSKYPTQNDATDTFYPMGPPK